MQDATPSANSPAPKPIRFGKGVWECALREVRSSAVGRGNTPDQNLESIAAERVYLQGLRLTEYSAKSVRRFLDFYRARLLLREAFRWPVGELELEHSRYVASLARFAIDNGEISLAIDVIPPGHFDDVVVIAKAIIAELHCLSEQSQGNSKTSNSKTIL